MPKFVRAAMAPSGLYRWIGQQLESAYAAADPRSAALDHPGRAMVAEIPRPVPEQVRRFRERLPLTVPAWLLDGHSAYAAGFAGVIPKDRAVRAVAYTVGPDDVITSAEDCTTRGPGQILKGDTPA
ncbi:hypothetical protein [Nocardia sp. CY41]|uniref:hypothetical protein n=1 Tax=Nocardia sp. CY41 TaxID=2608686 RepID=UPI00135BD924|nr:hypothetical protein [Nocardia sp. CY41]